MAEIRKVQASVFVPEVPAVIARPASITCPGVPPGGGGPGSPPGGPGPTPPGGPGAPPPVADPPVPGCFIRVESAPNPAQPGSQTQVFLFPFDCGLHPPGTIIDLPGGGG